MKKGTRIPVLVLAGLLLQINAIPQESLSRHRQSSWISGYLGFAGVVFPAVLNYEHLWQPNRVQFGTAAGLVATAYPDDSEIFLGGYLAFVFLTGTGNHHFEGRLGGSLHPFILSPHWQAGGADFPFIPVVSVGYRYQPPGGRRFYRVAFGTGGIGFGIGFRIGASHQEKGN